MAEQAINKKNDDDDNDDDDVDEMMTMVINERTTHPAAAAAQSVSTPSVRTVQHSLVRRKDWRRKNHKNTVHGGPLQVQPRHDQEEKSKIDFKATAHLLACK